MVENCIYLNPLVTNKVAEITSLIPPSATNQNFQFSERSCTSTAISVAGTSTDVYTLVTNPVTGAEFYIYKTLNYGEAIIIWFLTIFSIYMIFKVVYNFFWKK